MPMYDFSCECGFEYTDFDDMLGKKIRKCPSCEQNKLVRLIGCGSGFINSNPYRDKAGQKIYFKEPYFDTALRRNFSSAKEKAEFMNSNKIVERGDSDIAIKKERKEHHEHKMDTKKEKV